MKTESRKSGQDTETSDEPLVGVPSHPLAAGVAAAMAAATGAVVGTAAGPVGTAIGAVVGAVAGGLGGDAIASSIEEAQESSYWRRHFDSRPYVRPGSRYEDFGPAYAFGENARHRHGDRQFDEVAMELGQEWETARGRSNLNWDEAQPAARDAWEHWGRHYGEPDSED